MQICADCGTRNEDDEQFCGGCGSYLEWEGTETAPGDVVPDVPGDEDGYAGPADAPAYGEDDGPGDTYAATAAAEEAPAPADAQLVDAPSSAEPAEVPPDRDEADTPPDREERAEPGAENGAGPVNEVDAGSEDRGSGTDDRKRGGALGAAGLAGLGAARAVDRATGGRTGIGRVTGGGGLGGGGGASRLVRDAAGRAGVDTSALSRVEQAAGSARRGATRARPAAGQPSEEAAAETNGRPHGASATAPARPAPTRPAPTRPAPTQPRPADPESAAGAGVAPRKPAPVRPGAPARRPRVRPVTEDEPPPAPGDLICGSCGAGNTPQRKFCRRCGASLADAPVQPQRAWWRRLLRPDRRPAPKAGSRPKVRRRRRFPTGFVVTLLVLGLLAFGGWTFRDRVADGYEAVLDRISGVGGHTQYIPLHDDTTASSQADGRAAVQARDGLSNRSWSPELTGEEAEGESIYFPFEEPFRLLSVVITGGNSVEDAEEWRSEGRPAEVRLEIDTEGGDEPIVIPSVELENERGAQTVPVGGIDDVTAVRLTILDVYAGDVLDSVALAEVEFFGRD